jgi:hypothetical protein
VRGGAGLPAPASWMRLGFALWMTWAAAFAATCAEPAAGRLERDPRAQAAIEETVSAIVRHDEAAVERFAALHRLGERDRSALLLQMALYLEKADGTERSMAGAIILSRLEFTPKETIDVVVPRLEDAGPALRRVLAGMLESVDRLDGGEADLRVYDAWLAEHGSRPPAAFVAYLYDTSPDEAVHLMQRVYGRGAAPQPESARALDELKKTTTGRDVSRALTKDESARAAAALTTLSADPAWWVRRYAATVLRDDAALGPPALAERLKADQDPLVRDGLVRAPESGAK